MKILSKLTALLMALMMVFSTCASAFAAVEVSDMTNYAAALAASEDANIAASYFTISGVANVTVPPGEIPSGEIAAANMPSYAGYTFINATVNGIEVVSIGTITHNGTTYVYYTTEGSSDGLTAMVLGAGMKIQLNYKLDAVAINYSVTGDLTATKDSTNGGIYVAGIPYGGDEQSNVYVISPDAPTEVYPGDDYSFIVEIPRGYTATVTVNGTKVDPELGVSPTYSMSNNTISKTNNVTYALSAVYTVENVSAEQSVVVDIQKDETYSFSADLWRQTAYVGGGSRASSTVNSSTGWTGTVNADGTMTWVMTTEAQTGSQKWVMDSLQINETDINLPFTNNESVETILPSGTVITMTRVENTSGNNYNRSYSYTYTINISNCHEDLIVTGGNYNGTSWQEYIPYLFTGVSAYEYLGNSGDYEDGPISEPISYGNGSEWDMYSGNGMRFTLLPGYENPVVTFLANDAETVLQTITTFTRDGDYYVFNPNEEEWKGNYPVLMKIEAELGIYKVTYVSTDANVTSPEPIPVDTTVYSIAAGYHQQIVLSAQVPVDSAATNPYAFTGWKIVGDTSGTVYLPGDLINLTDVTGYATAGSAATEKIITFEAVWVEASSAEQITYYVQFVDEDNKVLYTGTYLAPANTALIVDQNSQPFQNFMTANPHLDVDADNVFYYEKITHGQTITIKMVERRATINYGFVNGCDENNGSLNPTSETVKVKTGTVAGSTPTAANGYKFVGWYTDQAGTTAVNGDWVDNTNKLTPVKEADALWTTVTYYAKFELDIADLRIAKTTVDGLNAEYSDTTTEFVFAVTVGDTAVTSYYVDDAAEATETSDGKVRIKSGQTATIKGITIGTDYSISEEVADGYVLKETPTNAKGAIVAGGVDVTFTNVKVADLSITKKVTGAGSSKDDVFTFTVTLPEEEGTKTEYAYTKGATSGKLVSGGTITLKHGETVVIADVPVNASYTVKETQNSNYTTDSLIKTDTISATEANTVEYLNIHNYGVLTISKSFSNNTTTDTAVFLIKDSNGDIYQRVSITGNGSATVQLPYGTYTIEEDGWAWTYTTEVNGSQNFTFSDSNKKHSVSYSNTLADKWLNEEIVKENKYN